MVTAFAAWRAVGRASRQAAALAFGLAIALAVASTPTPAMAAEAWPGQAEAPATFAALVDLFEREYWDPDHVDWRTWADEHRDSVLSATTRAQFDRALTRMVRALADDHSSWAGLPSPGDAPFGTDADPGLPEVVPPRLGVQYGFVLGRGLVVERVYPSTPAAEVGLQRGDVIVSVDGARLAGMSATQASTALVDALERGRATLEVERRRTSLTVVVTPAPVAFAEVAARPYGHMIDPTTGYLSVPTFNVAGVGAGAHAVLADLQRAGAIGLVLDLRGNLGGRLVELGALLGAFTEGVWAEGVTRGEVAWEGRFERAGVHGVARLVAVDGEVVAETRVLEPVRWTGPVVVLVGAENASAGEIAALALQDLGRARVVGERTVGNVEAVRGFGLPDGSRVMIAVANVQGVNGLDFDAGVVPDVHVRTGTGDLARGVDPAVAEARRLLGGLPFRPDRYF